MGWEGKDLKIEEGGRVVGMWKNGWVYNGVGYKEGWGGGGNVVVEEMGKGGYMRVEEGDWLEGLGLKVWYDGVEDKEGVGRYLGE